MIMHTHSHIKEARLLFFSGTPEKPQINPEQEKQQKVSNLDAKHEAFQRQAAALVMELEKFETLQSQSTNVKDKLQKVRDAVQLHKKELMQKDEGYSLEVIKRLNDAMQAIQNAEQAYGIEVDRANNPNNFRDNISVKGYPYARMFDVNPGENVQTIVPNYPVPVVLNGNTVSAWTRDYYVARQTVNEGGRLKTVYIVASTKPFRVNIGNQPWYIENMRRPAPQGVRKNFINEKTSNDLQSAAKGMPLLTSTPATPSSIPQSLPLSAPEFVGTNPPRTPESLKDELKKFDRLFKQLDEVEKLIESNADNTKKKQAAERMLIVAEQAQFQFSTINTVMNPPSPQTKEEFKQKSDRKAASCTRIQMFLDYLSKIEKGESTINPPRNPQNVKEELKKFDPLFKELDEVETLLKSDADNAKKKEVAERILKVADEPRYQFGVINTVMYPPSPEVQEEFKQKSARKMAAYRRIETFLNNLKQQEQLGESQKIKVALDKVYQDAVEIMNATANQMRSATGQRQFDIASGVFKYAEQTLKNLQALNISNLKAEDPLRKRYEGNVQYLTELRDEAGNIVATLMKEALDKQNKEDAAALEKAKQAAKQVDGNVGSIKVVVDKQTLAEFNTNNPELYKGFADTLTTAINTERQLLNVPGTKRLDADYVNRRTRELQDIEQRYITDVLEKKGK